MAGLVSESSKRSENTIPNFLAPDTPPNRLDTLGELAYRITPFFVINKSTIIQAFTQNFGLKDKAERSYAQLTSAKKRNRFTDRLNHRWDSVLDMKHLVQIGPSEDHAEAIQKLLNFRANDLCYTISNYSKLDDQFFPFQQIFAQIYAQGMGTILLNLSGDTLFLDTEMHRAPAVRFIGRKR